MKTFTSFTIFVIWILTNQMFSQVTNKLELRSDNPLHARIIPHSIQDEKSGHPSESDTFRDNEIRTTLKKTVLDNGFLLIEELRQDWDGSNWIDSDKITYTYDVNNNMIEYLWQDWDGSNWVNYWKYTYTYDMNNNLIEGIEQNWNGSNWVNDRKRTYTYDGNNNRIEQLLQTWDGFNWVNYWKNTYTYVITGIDKFEGEVNTYSLSQNYPNPFNPSTTINFSLPSSGYATLKIYNALGEEVAVLLDAELTTGFYEVEWNATNVPSGVYFYQLQTEGFLETKKMILLK